MRISITGTIIVLFIMYAPGCSSGTSGGEADTSHSEIPDVALDGEIIPAVVKSPSGYDEYGGVKDLPIANEAGFFKFALAEGRWWLVTPAGHAYISFGVNHISFDADTSVPLGYAPYRLTNQAWFGTDDKAVNEFYKYALGLLRVHGFNTVGAWSNAPNLIANGSIVSMPYTVILNFSAAVSTEFGEDNVGTVNDDGFPDVFDPKFVDNCKAYASDVIPQEYRDDPYLIGYFTDNELKWWGDGNFWPIEGESLADGFIAMPADAPGKQAFVDFLFQDLGYTVQTLNAAWGTSFSSTDEVAALDAIEDDGQHPEIAADKAAFVGKVAEVYFAAVDQALDEADPSHLNLCARFAVAAPDEVVAAARHCDVMTINDYYTDSEYKDGKDLSDMFGGDAEERFERQALLAGEDGMPKPVMLTEFGTRAADSGLPNGFGAGWVVDTQAQRGAYYRRVVDRLLDFEAVGTGFVVGFHWFEFTDEPKLGRFDGEDCNYGWVAVDGSPYLTFLAGLEAANEMSWDRLLGGEAKQLETPAGLKADVSDETVHLKWESVSGASRYRVLVATAPWFPGAMAREDWGGAKCEGPYDIVRTTAESALELDQLLAAGKWFWSVSAENPGQAIASDYSGTASFDMPSSCKDGHGEESLRCFEMPPPNIKPPFYDADGTVTVTSLRFESTDMVVPDAVFIANSLGKNHPVGGGEGAKVALVRHYPEPLSGSPASDRFCPAAVIATDGTLTTAASFIHVQHITVTGQPVIDRLLDPDGVIKPFSCAGPIKSADEPIIRKVYYIDTSDPLLPADVRLEVQLH